MAGDEGFRVLLLAGYTSTEGNTLLYDFILLPKN